MTRLSSKLIPFSYARRPYWSTPTTKYYRTDLRSPAYLLSNTVSPSLGRLSSALGRWLLVRNQPTRQAVSGSSTSPSSGCGRRGTLHMRVSKGVQTYYGHKLNG